MKKRFIFFLLIIFLVVFSAAFVYYSSKHDYRLTPGEIDKFIKTDSQVPEKPSVSPHSTGLQPDKDPLDEFEIHDRIIPPSSDISYGDYLKGNKTLGFKPDRDLCLDVVRRIKSDYVDSVGEEQLIAGVKAEVKNLLFEAGADYTAVDELPNNLAILTVLEEMFGSRVDGNLLYYAAVNGLFRGLDDKYSTFMTPFEFEEFVKQQKEQNYKGVGIRIAKPSLEGPLKVVEVFKDGPAAAAGLKKNDLIYRVDGRDVANMVLEEASGLISGDEDTSVKLSVKREGRAFDVDVIRKKVQIATVSGKILENEVGYIKIEGFKSELKDEFYKTYSELEKKNIKALIVDLRNNPGGLVSSAQYLCGFFLPRDSIISVFRHKGGKEREVKSFGRKIVFVPVAVLVNENSASSSEIISGALKDHGAATIIGTRTRGKGSVQRMGALKHKSGMKLTIEKIYTPKGFSIDKLGISPDVHAKEDYSDDKDSQLQAAIDYLVKKSQSDESKTASDVIEKSIRP